MKKLLSVLFVCLVIALGCAGTPTYTADLIPLVQTTVIVQADTGSEWKTIGSGVAVRNQGKRKILTARHVSDAIDYVDLRACATLYPDECISLPMESMNGKAYPNGLVDDWTLIQVRSFPKHVRAATIRRTRVRIGESIWVLGAPKGQAGEATRGVITNSVDDLYYIDARVIPGNSGGPVFDDDGKLIAILVAARVVPRIGIVPTWGIAVPVTTIGL